MFFLESRRALRRGVDVGSVRVLDVLGGGEAGSQVGSGLARTAAALYMESVTPLPAAACRACLASSSRKLFATLRSWARHHKFR